VGCGIDYRNNTIFYTLNGSLLGVAFTNVRGAEGNGKKAGFSPASSTASPFSSPYTTSSPSLLGCELYPTVGVDANVNIAFNDGTDAPFLFDLVGYIEGL